MGRKLKVKMSKDESYISIGEAFEDFIDDKLGLNLAPQSIATYKQAFDLFITYAFDGDYTVNVNDVFKIYVDQWKVGMLRDKQLRTTSINTYLRHLMVFLNWCMDDDRQYIEKKFKIELVKGQEPLPKIFSDEDVELLAAKPTRTNQMAWFEWRNWAIVNWVLATGNRAGTIINVKIGDVDFTNKEIYIRHTKNNKPQVLPLADSLAKTLKTYLKVCRSGCGNDDWLFPNLSNTKLSYSALARSFATYCHNRGVKQTNIHGLRHYFATYWARSGGSGDRLQIALGHSTYKMTQRYLHLVDRDLKEDYNLFNPLDNMKRTTNRERAVGVNNTKKRPKING